MIHLEQFKSLLRERSRARLGEIERAVAVTILDDNQATLAQLRADRAAILAIEVPEEGTREALIALWPAALGELPAWFLDPAAAALADRATAGDPEGYGADLVVDVSNALPPGEN